MRLIKIEIRNKLKSKCFVPLERKDHLRFSSPMKTIFITGANRGIGLELTKQMLDAGNKVLASCRDPEAATELQLCRENFDELEILKLDTDDEDSVKACFELLEQQKQPIDLLFNNAGIGAPAVPLEEISYEQWKSVVDVNLTGAFLCTQEAFKIMMHQKPRGGRIINNGSISAHVPRPLSSPYTATKHAITGLTRSTSLDGRPYDIACGQIDIGNAATEMTDRMAEGIIQADGKKAEEPRMAAENVANAVVYMAGLPLDANVLFMTVMATKMPFVGRG